MQPLSSAFGLNIYPRGYTIYQKSCYQGSVGFLCYNQPTAGKFPSLTAISDSPI
ncbi:MAG: hypothetical protein JGK17_24820 [Microcoleus sp. PH2017_10_PVI_O_A]|uniref:hypothetical protein n=1 Tax=unclassified Microcoleus TaxID=2642155 RepID=UPI001E19630F|nr:MULTISPECIES: hypothetical protein [unclassified Microcoleus]MCC3408738.1 hypothetical protein [Microcoleus sp. PH2017_10_PVI_O_A]MCC3462826.1 hypothetical protein [Microcoleus sp. PH2017_11_PCY_U_A]MCC3481309.1 hypothetical protein [Microcoleus sp. PH2017_12_PCY_D_A]MCC3529497.1 hypothetical protein [Microcoleus sp. PH2017_21_RUC_O_A]MCC3541714.1 hypothetical protein [Microcoleus sp. PH2017_22_RUC_O_B]